MSGISELLASFQMLNQGVQNFQRSRALSDANRAVADLRAAELDEFDKNLRLGEIVQNLQFNMMSLGSSAAEATGISQMLMPQSTDKFYQSVDQALINAKPGSQQWNKANEIFERRMQFQQFREEEAGRRAETRQQAIQGRFDRTQRDRAVREFNQEPFVKELKENLGLAEVQREQLENVRERMQGLRPDERPEGVIVKQTERILARFATNQRMSEQMAKEAGLSQTWYNQAQAALKRLGSENPTRRNMEVAIQLIEQYQESGNRLLERRATDFTRTRGAVLEDLGIEASVFRSTILGRDGGLGESQFTETFAEPPPSIAAPGVTRQPPSARDGARGRFRQNLRPR